MADTKAGDNAEAGYAANAASAGETVPPPLTGEIAASVEGKDITLGFFGKLRPMQDTVLAAKGGGLEIYEEVLRDWQCFSTFQQRQRAVTSKEWEVIPGAKDALSVKAADSLEAQLKAINFDNATHKMLFGLWYGHANSECLWGRAGSEIVIERIKVKKARRFRYDNDGGLRLLTRDNAFEGELMPPRKFWTFATGADNDDDPYGLGLGHYCYWPVWLKKNGYRFWSQLLDKFGMPTGVGKYPSGTSEADQAKLLAAVAAIQSSSGVIIPEGMMMELLEASRSGNVGNDQFVDRMDAAIAKVILSQTMTTDNGSSKSQSETHMDVREEVVKGDADLICSSFNSGPAKWLTDWNYPGAVPPRVWRKIEPPEDLDKLADRDKKIYDMGFEPSEDYIRDTYGEGWTKKAAPAPFPPAKAATQTDPAAPANQDSPAFAEPGDQDFAAMLAQQLDDAVSGPVDEMIDEVRKILDTSLTLKEFSERLTAAYPDLTTQGIGDALRDAFALADLTGRNDQTGG